MGVIYYSPFNPALFHPYPPDFKFNPRHYVNNTHTFIRGQNSLPFTLAGLSPSLLLSPSSFSPSTHPSLLSHGCFQTDPQPMCTRCPPTPTPHPYLHPIPQPVTAHSSVRYRQMELLSVLAPLSLSQPVSHTPHCLFCLPLSYPLPSEK